jgi:hypothetical protein
MTPRVYATVAVILAVLAIPMVLLSVITIVHAAITVTGLMLAASFAWRRRREE